MALFDAFLDCLKDQLGTISSPLRQTWADLSLISLRPHAEKIYRAISGA
jgi:hypothetical protein